MLGFVLGHLQLWLKIRFTMDCVKMWSYLCCPSDRPTKNGVPKKHVRVDREPEHDAQDFLLRWKKSSIYIFLLRIIFSCQKNWGLERVKSMYNTTQLCNIRPSVCFLQCCLTCCTSDGSALSSLTLWWQGWTPKRLSPTSAVWTSSAARTNPQISL